MRTRFYLPSIALALLCASSACKSKDDKSKAEATKSQNASPDTVAALASDAAVIRSVPTWYLVTLHSEEHDADVPFFLSVPGYGSHDPAVLRQGTESTEWPVAWRDASHFDVNFEMFQSAIHATLAEPGTLVGAWQQQSGSWGEAELAMRARAIDEPASEKLFGVPEGATLEPIAASGDWKLTMNDAGTVKLELAVNKAGGADAMLYFTSGNIIALAGQAANGKLRLAGFDGTSAYLLEAELEDGLLRKGSWLAGPTLSWQETFGGERSDGFTLKSGPRMKRPGKGVTVAGVDLSAYAGKPTIIEMGGSWCITCRFAAPFLRDIYAEFHPKGLEMVTLAYEFTDDEKYNEQRAAEFKSEYDIDWSVIPVTGGPEAFDEIMPKGLDDVDVSGFPISIFVGRDGVVEHVHAGFPGSKESEVYKTVTADYRKKVEALLAP